MASRKEGRIYLILNAIYCLISICLFAASLITNYWVTVTLQNNKVDKEEGSIYFGLFRGMLHLVTSILNSDQKIDVLTTYRDMMSMPLWGLTLGFLCFAAATTLLTLIFACLNIVSTPVEMITGIPGLYVWNILSALGYLLSMLFWVGEFVGYFQSNANGFVTVTVEDNAWTYEESNLGFSFWILLGCVILHLLNIGLLFWRGRKLTKPIIHSTRDSNNPQNDNITMLY